MPEFNDYNELYDDGWHDGWEGLPCRSDDDNYFAGWVQGRTERLI